MGRPRVKKLDGEGTAVRSQAISAELGVYREEFRQLMYRDQALRPVSSLTFFVKKSRSPSSMLSIRRQSKIVRKASSDEKEVKVEWKV